MRREAPGSARGGTPEGPAIAICCRVHRCVPCARQTPTAKQRTPHSDRVLRCWRPLHVSKPEQANGRFCRSGRLEHGNGITGGTARASLPADPAPRLEAGERILAPVRRGPSGASAAPGRSGPRQGPHGEPAAREHVGGYPSLLCPRGPRGRALRREGRRLLVRGLRLRGDARPDPSRRGAKPRGPGSPRRPPDPRGGGGGAGLRRAFLGRASQLRHCFPGTFAV
mmetsp:Transcript_102096/g.288903  ORF Transcript_102096/g.288903 Transcript_102096/m.288903 type:complete len:225 (+) Transcript_102096:96-770(+)